MATVLDYSEPGIFTRLPDGAGVSDDGSADAVRLCRPVHELVLQPSDAAPLGLPQSRFEENQIRPAERLVSCLFEMNLAPLSVPRRPRERVVGTCRHFAVLACALLRNRGIASRVRCGFATYFQPRQALDHWIVEYRRGSNEWVRLDPEILGGAVLAHPEHLQPGEFISGAEAWLAFRRGEIDASTYGVYGTENFGPAEIRGNLVKDLAAMNKVEMLPWDEWGRMTDAYAHRTGPDYDELLDEIARACQTDDPEDVGRLYEHPDLTVPPHLLTTGNPHP